MLVEFALVLIPLLLILFGALELGRAWNNKNDAVHLANEAARMAAVNQINCATLQGERSTDGLPGSTTITIPGASLGQAVTVTVNVPFTSSLLKLMPFLPNSVSGTATMRAEQTEAGATC